MLQRNNIRRLDKDIASQIAAGEVVTRPFSIVKELLENSIDAGATSIVIEIRDGGKTYLRVTDNGCGIPTEELPLAFERHATSKITKAEDLSDMRSLGFRGEALASIAAVSRVEMITKTPEEAVGSRILLEGGEIIENGPTGCPDGTTIVVRDLFYNTPARLKFLKPTGTESSLIIDFVSRLTLAYPNIRMRLINNGSILFSTNGKGSIRENILTIYNKEIEHKLIQSSAKAGDFELDAFVSAPDNSRTNRKYQVFFVNGRAVTSKVLEEALFRAYKERMEKDRQPVAFLFLNVNPARLDVNIHPNKQEVRFDNNEEILDFATETIRNALLKKEAIPEIKERNLFRLKDNSGLESLPTGGTLQPHSSDSKPDHTTEIEEMDRRSVQADMKQIDIISLLSSKRAEQVNLAESERFPGRVEETAERYSIWDDLKITGVLFNTYITAVDGSYFYLFDQHAAHERIFYEKLLDGFRNEKNATQLLMTPVVKETLPAISQRFPEWEQQLYSMGFDVSLFGQRSILIKGIPTFMNRSEGEEFLSAFLDQIDTLKNPEDRNTISKIIMQACKSAVKANQKLSQEEMEQLIQDLAESKQPYSCPHGRPTFLRLSKAQIEKMFLRT